jgi:stearoyl-CoA desaturase (delta-9 desaturase)
VINLAAVLLPIIGLLAAIVLTWGTAIDWVQLIILVGMVHATSIGITIGYHRLFTHRSFQAGAPLRYLLAALGSMALQGPVIEWVGAHRQHHQHSDDHDDPHSPYNHAGGSWGAGIVGTLRGFYHAHVGWLFRGRLKGLGRYTRDLRDDPVIRAVNSQFYLWVLLGLVIPAALGGLVTWSFRGALLGFLWGGLVRILIVHHVTWSVNSVCHLWGSRPFACDDESRNNPIIGVLALGEGWHNNHHAFPTSARHGLRWWELDISYLYIRALATVGLARKVRLPDRDRMEAKRRRALDAKRSRRAGLAESR